ncbi:MAG TPA: dipeptidase [Candidatus Limnocylindria bacterium]|nr:dipeptidase [Candidatus Limnocylindria bacterium]
MATIPAADARARVRELMPEVRADLERLVRIPSVSAAGHDPAPLVKSAELVAEFLRAAGGEVRVLRAKGEGHPAVVGYWKAPPGTPTVLLYAHHDVQPPGPDSEWTTPPFEPTERDGRLYGRGAADDKAGVLAHVAALRAYDGKPPVGVAVFVEGEEEAGSERLRGYLEGEGDRLRCDAVVVADGGNWRIGAPAITTTLRGVVACVIEIRVLDKAVHSGGFGGPLPDALTTLAKTLATLHDERGRVAIEGLAHGKAPALDLTEAELREQAGARRGVKLIGDGGLTDRMWMMPAVSVLALDAPPVREAVNQLVPVARAKVSLRIPPGQDATKALDALVKHLERNVPWGAEVRIERHAVGEPFATKTGGTAYRAMHAALSEAWGKKAVDVGSGGSIPFLFDFAELFPKAEILVTGVDDPQSGPHGPDEGLHLAEFERVCLAETLFLSKLAG